MGRREKILVTLSFVLVLSLFWTRVYLTNHILWDLQESAGIWAERTESLRHEIGWLHDRVDALKIPEPEPLSLDTIMQSVVHIEADFSWQGSGAYVGNGLILTAGHVVENAYEFVVTFEDGTICESYQYYREPTADVGFIYLGDCNAPSLQFDDDSTYRGDSVYIFGNPFGWSYNFSVTKGIISSVNRDCEGFFGDKIMLQADAAAYSGNSGGPVTDDEGEIIGILVGGTYGGDNISLIIPADICEASMKIYLAMLELAEME